MTMIMKMIYDDDNNANYEKNPIKQTRNKKRKESVTI